MAHVLVKIDRIRRVASFTGPGTYAARDLIKALGEARWVQAEKKWVVERFELSHEELSLRIGNVVIEEEIFDESATTVSIEPSAPAPAAVPQGISVGELTSMARAALRNAFPAAVMVYGVISSVKAANGRVFLDLADPERPDEVVKCVIWRDAERICKPLLDAGFKLETELQVMFAVQVGLSRKRSELSLEIVRVIAEYTLGKVAALREQTNERLKREGLFERNKGLALPFLPRRLGLLTSAGGTVINDFQAALDAAKFGFELLWRNVNVQGPAAKPQLLDGLSRLSAIQGIDAILIFRGGGSAADLSVFNDYELARAVCLCPVPVLSAIGHQEDQSSVQDVSFQALGVPKDLGHYFARLVLDRRNAFRQSASVIRDTVNNRLCTAGERLMHFTRHLHALGMKQQEGRSDEVQRYLRALPLLAESSRQLAAQRFVALSRPIGALAAQAQRRHEERLRGECRRLVEQGARLTEMRKLSFLHAGRQLSAAVSWSLRRLGERTALFGELLRGAGERLRQHEQELQSYSRMVADASPEVQLKRGFALAKRPGSDAYVTSGSVLERGDTIELQFHDQTKDVTVK